MKNQQGVSFLEIIVVIAILTIVVGLVAPNVSNWRSKSELASDYHALVSHIDYIKTRGRVLNGTATLECVTPTQLTYKISTNPQYGVTDLSPNFATNLVEDPLATNSSANILSGNSTVFSQLCNNQRGIFLSNSQTGLETSGNQIIVELNVDNDRKIAGAYRVVVSQTTGFVQKYKWNIANNSWVEQD